MELTEAQYTALQHMFPGCALDTFSNDHGIGILVTEVPVPKDHPMFNRIAVKAEDVANLVEDEADQIERVAMAFSDSYYGRGSWDNLTPEGRLGLRMRARRYLGL